MCDQSEIDALLASAMELSPGSSDDSGGDGDGGDGGPMDARDVLLGNLRGDFNRILRLRVPIIVQLASRKMAYEELLKVAAGAIIEFECSSDESLTLLIGNREVGQGQAVKVGENFGLRISDIGSVRDRIEALGPG